MYAGSYLDESENIGHEVINLFKDDNGSNYIYLNPSGAINKEYRDSVEAILLVKHVEKGVLEVIAKAEGLHPANYKVEGKFTNQNEYIEDNKIRYGDVLLSDIYKNGHKEILITFKADDLRTVNKPVFLIEDETKLYKYENRYFLPEKHFSTQSLRMYYPKNKFPQDYKVFQGLLKDPIWNSEDESTAKINLDEIHTYDPQEGFLSVIKKEDDELVMSNLFSYIFNQEKSVFSDFVKQVLDIGDFEGNYTITREKHNIDLLIENDEYIIIIENKIKSKINGEKPKSGDKIESQLSKYAEYAEEEYSDKKLEFFIFAPDYNKIDLNKYKDGDKYTPIEYSKIYCFYFENAGRMLDVEYFKEYLCALKMHKESTDNTNYEKMKRKFIKNIKDIKKFKSMLESKN